MKPFALINSLRIRGTGSVPEAPTTIVSNVRGTREGLTNRENLPSKHGDHCLNNGPSAIKIHLLSAL